MYDVEPNELIDKAAEELKNIEAIKPADWAHIVKTGAHKERPPARADWWYVRAAAMLRAVRKLGPIGVSKLRVKYGGKKHRGHKLDKFYKGSGNIIRKILQQLEKAELIKKAEKGSHKGRMITSRGVSILDKAAKSLSKAKKPKEEPKKEEKAAESPVKVKEKKQPKEEKADKEKEEPKKEKKSKNG